MTFPTKDWKNDPDTSTPLSAEALEDMESRLGAYTDTRANAAQSAAEDSSVNYTNTQINTHQHITNQIQTAGIQNGAVTAAKIDPTLRVEAAALRASSIVPTPGTITSTTFAASPTPVGISGIVVPSNGLLSIAVRAVAKAVTTLNVGSMQVLVTKDGVSQGATEIATGDAQPTAYDDIVTNIGAATTGYDTIWSTVPVDAAGSMWITENWENAPNHGIGPLAGFVPLRGVAGSTVDFSLQWKVSSASLLLSRCEMYVKVETF